jgi:hypothetical protein
MSKGSKQRPGQGYQDGWDRIFGKKEWYMVRLDPECEKAAHKLTRQIIESAQLQVLGSEIQKTYGESMRFKTEKELVDRITNRKVR